MEYWRTLMANVILVFALLCLILHGSQAAKIKTSADINEDSCEVCVQFMQRFVDTLDEATKKSEEKIENAFRKFCKHTKKDDNRFCYYVGGLEESATGMLGQLAKPISWSAPVTKVCHKLYTMDSQICDLKYEKKLDLGTINLKKLKVRELKIILSDWDEKCKGCTEKSDFIELIEELMPKYDPVAYEKRQKAEL